MKVPTALRFKRLHLVPFLSITVSHLRSLLSRLSLLVHLSMTLQSEAASRILLRRFSLKGVKNRPFSSRPCLRSYFYNVEIKEKLLSGTGPVRAYNGTSQMRKNTSKASKLIVSNIVLAVKNSSSNIMSMRSDEIAVSDA